nr:hypothetical protein [Angustibacter aerolatus]
MPTRVALTATAAALAVQPVLASPADAGTTIASILKTKPTPTKTLPTKLDVVPSYQDQRSRDPAAKPGVEAYARMVLTTYRQGHSGGIVRGCGIGATSEHKEGRAFDWMLSVNKPAEKAAGDAFTKWLTGKDEHGVVGGHARRLGVMYVIWNKRIWSTYRLRQRLAGVPRLERAHRPRAHQLHLGRRDEAHLLVGRHRHHGRRHRPVPRVRRPARGGLHHAAHGLVHHAPEDPARVVVRHRLAGPERLVGQGRAGEARREGDRVVQARRPAAGSWAGSAGRRCRSAACSTSRPGPGSCPARSPRRRSRRRPRT